MAQAASRIIIATDDERIAAEVASFGGESVMTPPELTSGSERVAWVAERTEGAVFVNVQGDEPLMPPATIDAAVAALADSDADIATAACPLRDSAALSNPNVVKVVTDVSGIALYFSRAGIPFDRDGNAVPDSIMSAGDEAASGGTDGNASGAPGVYLKHIGIYAFRREALLRFASLPAGRLEQLEKLEQLRALEHGMRIAVAVVPADSQAVDTPEDVLTVEAILRGATEA